MFPMVETDNCEGHAFNFDHRGRMCYCIQSFSLSIRKASFKNTFLKTKLSLLYKFQYYEFSFVLRHFSTSDLFLMFTLGFTLKQSAVSTSVVQYGTLKSRLFTHEDSNVPFSGGQRLANFLFLHAPFKSVHILRDESIQS